jgi:hypothetical protein
MDICKLKHDGVISYGGGVNSTAMIIRLYEQGCRCPIVIGETGCERPETDAFIPVFRSWLKKKYDTSITVISPPSEYHSPRINKLSRGSLYGYCGGALVIPLIGQRWCTSEFKRDPVNKWARKQGARVCIIGISWEEKHRALRIHRGLPAIYPLIDAQLDREDCKKIISDACVPVPTKSGCYFCMYQRIGQWRNLWKKFPDHFGVSRELEEKISRDRGVRTTIRPREWLHSLETCFKQENPLFPEMFEYDEYEQFVCPECRM